MSEEHQQLRALGYVLDGDDDWILPGLRLRAEDPQALLAAPIEELQAFHDPALWIPIDPEPTPPIQAQLRRTARALDVVWDGWLRAWDAGGAWLLTEQLEQLGEQGLKDLVEHARSFEESHRFRVRMGCAGLFAMFAWLLFGWLAGVSAWLIGMLVIAGVTLFFRPRAVPEDLWGVADEEMLVRAVDAGCLALEPEWEEAASALGAIPAGPEHLHLVILERCVSIETLQSRFTPAGMLQILHSLTPIQDELD